MNDESRRPRGQHRPVLSGTTNQPSPMRARSTLIGLALLAALCTALLTSHPAEAAAPVYESSFACTEATPCGAFESWKPGRLAVDDASGDVFVIDEENDAIQVFDSDGDHESSILGSSTDAGSFSFSPGVSPATEDDIAIDNSGGAGQGRIYLNSEVAGSVFAFEASRAFDWEKSGLSFPCGIAVDPAGALFVAEFEEGVKPLSTVDGSTAGSPVADTNESCGIAFNAASDLYVRRWGVGDVFKYLAPSFADPGIALGSDPHDKGYLSNSDVEVDRSIGRLYLPNYELDAMVAYTIAGVKVSGSPFGNSELAGGFPEGAAVNGITHDLYVSDPGVGRNEIHVYSRPVHLVDVTVDGTGGGSVSADSGAIAACSSSGGTCSDSYEAETTVILTATPALHSAVGWSGCPLPIGNQCVVTVGSDVSVTATFETITHTLSIGKAGSGSGSVTCKAGAGSAGACAPSYDEGTTITLAASAAPGSTFAGWSGGGCTGTSGCTLTLEADTVVTATFDAIPPVIDGGGGGGGASGGGAGPAPPAPVPVVEQPPAKKPLKCKKGFKKRTVKGKQKCVKVKKKPKKRSSR